MVSALLDPRGYPGYGQLGVGDPEEMDVYGIAEILEPPDAIGVSHAAQGALESEIDSCCRKAIQFRQKNPARGHGGDFRLQGRNARGDGIRVDEMNDFREVGKEVSGKGGLAGPVGTGNYDAAGFWFLFMQQRSEISEYLIRKSLPPIYDSMSVLAGTVNPSIK
jgi:hypothetical protein